MNDLSTEDPTADREKNVPFGNDRITLSDLFLPLGEQTQEPGVEQGEGMRSMNEQDNGKERSERMARLGLQEGDYYFSPEGYLVFTQQYHLKRGQCCQSGCRHCPYGTQAKKVLGRTG